MTFIKPFLENLYNQTYQPYTGMYHEEWKQNLRARFQEQLGEFSYSSKEDFYPKLVEKIETEEYVRLRVEITTIGGLRAPVYILIPTTNTHHLKLPAVLALHGHGYGSKEMVGLQADGAVNDGEPGIHKNCAIQLVRKGLVVVAPEIIGFGDRRLEADIDPASTSSNSCFSIASQLLVMGKTLAGLRVFECRRIIDYLITLDEVDSQKIGCMGFSGGGLVAAFTSILDDRIKATVITGYTNTFKGSIMDRKHCLDNYVPGILQHAELPELIGLIAPRPLFIEAGKQDHLFPIEHVKHAVNVLTNIYQSFDSSDELNHDYFEGRHEISGAKSFDWLYSSLVEGK
ncbi:dienelactone hydrolase family protein [Bacillus sp. AK128]